MPTWIQTAAIIAVAWAVASLLVWGFITGANARDRRDDDA